MISGVLYMSRFYVGITLYLHVMDLKKQYVINACESRSNHISTGGEVHYSKY